MAERDQQQLLDPGEETVIAAAARIRERRQEMSESKAAVTDLTAMSVEELQALVARAREIVVEKTEKTRANKWNLRVIPALEAEKARLEERLALIEDALDSVWAVTRWT